MLDVSVKDFEALSDGRFVNVPEPVRKIRRIKGVSIDSRAIEPQQVFWALKGERFDGHDFVGDVVLHGALFAVVARERFESGRFDELPLFVVEDTLAALQELARHHRRKYNIPVIALTGSNGKTTTKEMIAHILGRKTVVHKTHGNRNNQIGCPLAVLDLNEMHRMAVFELGTNQFGEIDILTRMVEPDHVLITLIGDTHLEYLQNREGVAREKLSLFRQAPPGVTLYKNMDDPFIAAFEREDARVVSYGFDRTDVDVHGAMGDMDAMGCGTLILNGRVNIPLRAPGLHNVRNALAAAAVALNLGWKEAEIAAALESYESFEKRMQVVHWRDCLILNDSYNANPASMYSAMNTLMRMAGGKRFMALGDMNELGEHSDAMHREVLQKALDHGADAIFILGDKMIRAVNQLGLQKNTRVHVCQNHFELASMAAQMMSAGDILLLKASRGVQMEKVLAGLPV